LNLLPIAQKLWRYKLVTLPILAFVLIGSFYVIAIKAPVYNASSIYNLLPAPPPPTSDQIAADPRLGRINTNNPYTLYSDQSVVGEVLASQLSSDAARAALVKRGADPSYEIAPSVELGYSAPILEVTGTGSSPEEAVRTAKLVGRAAKTELEARQQEVARAYRIGMKPVVLADHAELKASGQLRTLVGVWAIGGILLFLGVSIADALNALRDARGKNRNAGGGRANARGKNRTDGGSGANAARKGSVEQVPADDLEEHRLARAAADGASSAPETRSRAEGNGNAAGNGNGNAAGHGNGDAAGHGVINPDEGDGRVARPNRKGTATKRKGTAGRTKRKGTAHRRRTRPKPRASGG
jgi:hypothetical protein